MSDKIEEKLNEGWTWRLFGSDENYILWPPPSDKRNEWSMIAIQIDNRFYIPNWLKEEYEEESQNENEN